MRVLVASIPLPTNRFLADLNGALAELCALRHSSDAFWNMEGDYAVVHLHFPEYLTYEIEEAYRKGLRKSLIDAVGERLRFWAQRASIIVTRHVLLPHDGLRDPMWETMYESVYSYADGIVHFGQPSVDEFLTRYQATTFYRGRMPRHTIIPHHNYCSLPNEIGRKQAREMLGISQDARVMLVFGAIRSWEERQLVVDTFRRLELPRKVLLASRWKERDTRVSWIRLRNWLRDLTRFYDRLHPRHHFNYGFVEEADTQIYLNAADVLFIPRLRVLNSGNATLGMTFGRVVTGPDSWDVGELLRRTGNPVFEPDKPETAVRAVMAAFRLADEGQVGPSNRKLALAEWGVERCAAEYLQFFGEVVASVMTTSTVSSSQ